VTFVFKNKVTGPPLHTCGGDGLEIVTARRLADAAVMKSVFGIQESAVRIKA